MKVTTLGVIQAVKNVGLWLGTTYTLVDIEANPMAFLYAFIIYICVSVPSDLYLLNKAHEDAKTEGSK